MSNLWKQFNVSASIEWKPRTDRRRVTTVNENCYLPLTVRDNKSAIAFQLSREFYATTDSWILRIAVCRRLQDRALFAITPAFLRPAHFCQQMNPFNKMQRSFTLDQESMGDNPFIWWVSVWPKYKFSTYFHLEKTRNPLPAFQLPRKRPVRQRRFDGLNRHHVRWAHNHPCVREMLYDSCKEW